MLTLPLQFLIEIPVKTRRRVSLQKCYKLIFELVLFAIVSIDLNITNGCTIIKIKNRWVLLSSFNNLPWLSQIYFIWFLLVLQQKRQVYPYLVLLVKVIYYLFYLHIYLKFIFTQSNKFSLPSSNDNKVFSSIFNSTIGNLCPL